MLETSNIRLSQCSDHLTLAVLASKPRRRSEGVLRVLTRFGLPDQKLAIYSNNTVSQWYQTFAMFYQRDMRQLYYIAAIVAMSIISYE